MIGILLKLLLVLAWVLGGLLVLLLLVLLSPARVRLALQGQVFSLWVGLGPVRLRLLPARPKKPKKQKKPRRFAGKKGKADQEDRPAGPEQPGEAGRPAVTIESQPEPPPRKAQEKEGKNPAGKKLDFEKIKLTVEQLTGYIRLAVEAMGRLVRLLTVRRLQIHAVVATGDAASTAIAFGSAAAALNLLLPWLEQRLRIKNQDIAVECAFEQQQSTVEFDIEIRALVGQLLFAAVRVGLQFWKLYQENQEKAVSL